MDQMNKALCLKSISKPTKYYDPPRIETYVTDTSSRRRKQLDMVPTVMDKVNL